ncbi:MAG: 4-hydroxy-tetrahydrodipicolinate synthase [Spirochaetes bacterium GWF1_51_8]|nr:MAG: 4-hydroxy-tetrahydrodipicolinate synthase [Spirochaetes bacterium GWF1_51_8]
MFKGSFVALITPFKNGQVDYEGIEKLIEFHIAEGTHGIVPMGTTGESATVSHEEHKEIVRFVTKKVDKRIMVIAGSGSNSTAEAIELALDAKKAGADAHLSITPYYNKPTQEGLYRHFKAIAEAVDLPMVVYNVPGRTGVNMAPSTVARLSKVPNIVGLKEAAGTVKQVMEVLELTGPDFCVLSGDDFINFPVLAVGGRGYISVTANIAPKRLAECWNLWEKGDIEGSKKAHYSLLPLHRDLFIETSPIPVKTSAHLMGLIGTLEFRPPLCELTDSSLAKLKETLKAQGLIK